jgi:hypothetical protein
MTVTGRVVDGRVIPDEPLPEGANVLITLHHDGGFDVDDPELEAELLAAIAESERGEGIPWEELRRRLRDDRR